MQGEEKPSTKRKRIAYQPNEAELRAEARHKRVEASLLAAHTHFRRWLGSLGATTIQEALRKAHGRPHQPSSPSPAKANEHAASRDPHSEKVSRSAPDSRSPVPAAKGDQRSQSHVGGEEDPGGEHSEAASDSRHGTEGYATADGGSGGAGAASSTDPPPSLDLLSLAQMAGVLKPKFRFVDDETRHESGNLFNRWSLWHHAISFLRAAPGDLDRCPASVLKDMKPNPEM